MESIKFEKKSGGLVALEADEIEKLRAAEAVPNALIRGADSSEGLTWFRATTMAMDRHGTIIEPDGVSLERYSQNPIFGWAHDVYGRAFGDAPPLENILGRVEEVERDSERIDIGVRWADHPHARMARSMVRDGMLSSVSVGFLPHEVESREIEGVGEVPVFTRTEMIENSLVPIPSNPEAVLLARAWQNALPMVADAKASETRGLFPPASPPRSERAATGDGFGAHRARVALRRLRMELLRR